MYGIFIGLVTFAIRYFGSMNEGMSFAILLGNLMVPGSMPGAIRSRWASRKPRNRRRPPKKRPRKGANA